MRAVGKAKRRIVPKALLLSLLPVGSSRRAAKKETKKKKTKRSGRKLSSAECVTSEREQTRCPLKIDRFFHGGRHLARRLCPCAVPR